MEQVEKRITVGGFSLALILYNNVILDSSMVADDTISFCRGSLLEMFL